MRFSEYRGAFLILMLSLCAFGCTKKEIWIYTNLSKDVIAELDPALRAALPEANPKWFQGGNENIAKVFAQDLAEDRPKADLIVANDPFWFLELKKKGLLQAYASPAARDVTPQYTDPEGVYSTVQLSVMVIGYNPEAISFAKPSDQPARWKDLGEPRFKSKISMGNPLESGISLTAVAALSSRLGWDLMAGLRANNVMTSGGNNSVFQRILSGERPIGIVMLETILKAQELKLPVRPIYPLDGIIPIPGHIAIPKRAHHLDTVKKAYDWFFSAEAQNALVHGGNYSPLPKIMPPETAKQLSELQPAMLPVTTRFLAEIYETRDRLKAKFSETVLH